MFGQWKIRPNALYTPRLPLAPARGVSQHLQGTAVAVSYFVHASIYEDLSAVSIQRFIDYLYEDRRLYGTARDGSGPDEEGVYIFSRRLPMERNPRGEKPPKSHYKNSPGSKPTAQVYRTKAQRVLL